MANRARLRASILGLFLLIAPSGASAGTDLGRTFLGPDGAPLPFQDDDEILEFLRTADVIDEKPIGQGINNSRKLLLHQDGIRAHAVFREVDVTKRDAHIAGAFYRIFRDSYRFEPAAYQLAKLLGIHNVPPAVLRRVSGRSGSLQLWIENVRDHEERLSPPNVNAWVEQVRDMVLFDNLIFNADRNSGNLFTTHDYTLIMIDHTRAFQPKAALVDPERLTHVSRRTWERLRSLSEEEISDVVRPFLTPYEISKLKIRYRMVLDHLEELIAARGEKAVVI